MKLSKIIAIALVLASLLTLFACGSTETGKTSAKTEKTAEKTAEKSASLAELHIDAIKKFNEGFGNDGVISAEAEAAVSALRKAYDSASVAEKADNVSVLDSLIYWETCIKRSHIRVQVRVLDVNDPDVVTKLEAIIATDDYQALTESDRETVLYANEALASKYLQGVKLEARIEKLSSLTGSELKSEVAVIGNMISASNLDERFVRNMAKFEEAKDRYYMEMAAEAIAKIEDATYDELVARTSVTTYSYAVKNAVSAIERVSEAKRTSVVGYDKLVTAALYCQAVPLENAITEMTEYKFEQYIVSALDRAVKKYEEASESARALVRNLDVLNEYHIKYKGTPLDGYTGGETSDGLGLIYSQFGRAIVDSMKNAGSYSYYAYSIETVDGAKSLVVSLSVANLDAYYAKAMTDASTKTAARALESGTFKTLYNQCDSLVAQAVADVIGASAEYSFVLRIVDGNNPTTVFCTVTKAGIKSVLD